MDKRERLGCMSPRHVHEREAETSVVLDGALEGRCAGETQLVGAGSHIYLPAGREHAFRVASSTDLADRGPPRPLVAVHTAGIQEQSDHAGVG